MGFITPHVADEATSPEAPLPGRTRCLIHYKNARLRKLFRASPSELRSLAFVRQPQDTGEAKRFTDLAIKQKTIEIPRAGSAAKKALRCLDSDHLVINIDAPWKEFIEKTETSQGLNIVVPRDGKNQPNWSYTAMLQLAGNRESIS